MVQHSREIVNMKLVQFGGVDLNVSTSKMVPHRRRNGHVSTNEKGWFGTSSTRYWKKMWTTPRWAIKMWKRNLKGLFESWASNNNWQSYVLTAVMGSLDWWLTSNACFEKCSHPDCTKVYRRNRCKNGKNSTYENVFVPWSGWSPVHTIAYYWPLVLQRRVLTTVRNGLYAFSLYEFGQT